MKIIKEMFSYFTKLSVAFFICIIAFCALSFEAHAYRTETGKIVKVGFFAFEGYHETDKNNYRSGYGYEYLHEMAKYNGWIFEYVDGTWEECQEMLKTGKIDLVTSAQYTDERSKMFDFSTAPMGTSYAQLTVVDGNNIYGRNDFASFQGIKIGLLKGNSRNNKLAEFAKEKRFAYVPVMYNSQDELDEAIKTGAIDAILTSSLRKPNNERIIAQFAPAPFYAIVKKGNQELLNQVNFALESIEINTPAFRHNLYQEYYRADTTDTFVLSREEKEYLKTRPIVRAAVLSDISPISYWENGQFMGISADIMNYLFANLNIQVEYVLAKSPEEMYQMIANGNADIACLFESDYNLAERHNARITSPYFKANYSVLSRQQGNNNQSVFKIALPEGNLLGTRYAKARYPNAQIVYLSSNYEAIKSVSQEQADLTVVNVYSAEKALVNFPNLRASFISDDAQQFSVGISQATDVRLYSILDKKINSMNTKVFNDIVSKHTLFNQDPVTLADYFRQNPLQVIFISLVFFLIIIAILFYIALMNKRYAKNIYNLAYVDSLTKLWNVNGFINQGKTLLAKFPNNNFAVAAIDLSNFSGVNENHGHNMGDQVIKSMGNALKLFNNERTVVAHADGDHFLMLLCYEDMAELHAILSSIAGALSSYNIESLTLNFKVYMGVGLVTQRENALQTAVHHANIARGKCATDQMIVYMDEELQNNLLREKEILNHVEYALKHNEFLVYYQPKVDMTNNRIIGAEALIRWNHSKLGFLSPAEFIPILEQKGIITEVDFYVFEQVCKMIRHWIDSGQEPILMSVNQSRAHFLKKNYIERLHNLLIQYNIPPGFIELEITETLFGQEAISETLIKKIKSIGLLMSIDDFGSGYSSLYLLHQISVDILKIDKRLLDEGAKHEKVRNIILRISQLANDLGVDVIFEGVETQEQVDFLLNMNCKYAQGFFYSKPLPQEEFEEFVKSRKIIF